MDSMSTSPEGVRDLVVTALEDLKGFDIKVLDVRGMTAMTDWLVLASGSSNRQVSALARKVHDMAKAQGLDMLGMEGEKEGEWVLIDLNDVVVHVMQPRIRDFYQLEKLWSESAEGQRSASSS